MNGGIYADVYIIINFFLDYLSLYVSVKLVGVKVSFARLICAATVGAVYAFAALFFKNTGLMSQIIHILVSVTICLIAAHTSGFVQYLKLFVVFYLTSFVLAGGFEAVKNISENMGYSGKLSIFAIATITLVIYILWGIFGKYLTKRLDDKALDFDIEVSGKRIHLCGLVDSGNKLTEPLSCDRVIIVKSSALIGKIPIPLFNMLKGKFENIPYEYAELIKIIPVTGVGYSGIMYGFRPEKIKIYSKRKVYGKTNFTIAADFTKGDFSGFDAIVPSL